ncbi:hypothetical protein SAMN05192583_0592 [Sphingomonas gellani]|uniref:Uncharacterized protein n=1 Tax=Sphingomonas gellani TaxID=1166340 RepID=A0A1H7ZBZ3_9SPHN|nr:hypothetical protein [Sphingomonas gellani]SEM55027.1 hypothetical protein SAMN05192583_0592 [Sphingomonas gellani]
MPFDKDEWNRAAVRGEAGGAYLSIAITINPIIVALEKIEAKTGVDLTEEKKRLDEINIDAFKRFQELTGWTSAE